MSTQDTLALAATIWDEAKRLENQHLGQSGFTTHTMRCQTLYLKLCEQAPGEALPDARVIAAALKVTEALGETDVTKIRVPSVLALALLNLERVVRRSSGEELKHSLKDERQASLYRRWVAGELGPDGPNGIHARAALGVALELLKQEQAFADTLAKKCDELAAENERLESENHNLKGTVAHYEVERAR